MGHGHHHHHNHGDEQRIGVAFALNVAFTIVEIIGGLLTNSLAILSDAIHDLGDSLSLGLAWYFQKLSRKGRDEKFSYGYRRFSLLGAIVNSIVLVAGSILILREAIPRLLDPQQVDPQGMLFLAILGVFFNGLAVLKLRGGSGMNARVVSLHLLEDVLGWVAILIASVVMMFVDVPILDPILSIAILAFVGFNAAKALKASLGIVLQGTPPDLDLESLWDDVRTLPHVTGLHDCHVWTMDGDYHVASIHIVVDEDLDVVGRATVKRDVRALLDAVPIKHVTIEIETPSEPCALDDC